MPLQVLMHQLNYNLNFKQDESFILYNTSNKSSQLQKIGNMYPWDILSRRSNTPQVVEYVRERSSLMATKFGQLQHQQLLRDWDYANGSPNIYVPAN